MGLAVFLFFIIFHSRCLGCFTLPSFFSSPVSRRSLRERSSEAKQAPWGAVHTPSTAPRTPTSPCSTLLAGCSHLHHLQHHQPGRAAEQQSFL